MEDIVAKIGEHIIAIRCDTNHLVKGLYRNIQILNPDNFEVDLFIKIEGGYGVPFQNYDVKIKKDKNNIFFKRADYLIDVDSNFKNAVIFVHDELTLKHALMNLYSSFIVHHNWGLLIHSSCVIENGEAHLFAGQSGAGKSTAAKLSAPRELLSDEATILKITPNAVTVFDSPFRSELEGKGSQKEVPLTSMQILHQSLINQRQIIKKSDALLYLMDKVFYWSHSPEEMKQILHLLKSLVQNVPAYDLYFQKNNKFWELITS